MVMPYVDALTTWDIDFGHELWQALRQNKTLPAHGVFWLLGSENGWRLLVATPRVDEVGRRKAYEELGNIQNPLPRNHGRCPGQASRGGHHQARPARGDAHPGREGEERHFRFLEGED